MLWLRFENWNESIWIEKNEAVAATMTTAKAVIQIKWYKNLSPSATAVASSSSSSFTISAVKPHIGLVCVRAGGRSCVCPHVWMCVYIDWPFICMPINCRYYIWSVWLDLWFRRNKAAAVDMLLIMAIEFLNTVNGISQRNGQRCQWYKSATGIFFFFSKSMRWRWCDSFAEIASTAKNEVSRISELGYRSN